MRMRIRIRALILLLAAASALAACASAEQWAEWRRHSSHFASEQHMLFSLRHQGDNPTPRVRQRDVDTARGESWWGDPIVVRPDQLFAG